MIFIIISVVIFGLIIGSFLTSVIHRLPDIESLIKGRSHCPKCKRQLGVWDLIPLISFVFLAGKCRYCSKKISWHYPLIEFLTATLFLIIYLKFDLTIKSLFLAIISSGLIGIIFYDLEKMIIPDEILTPLIIISFVYIIVNAIINKSITEFNYALIGAAIFSGIILLLFVISKGKWIGFGDAKLAILLGLILGYPHAITAFFLAFLVGGLVGLILMAIGKKHLKDKVPLAPFMIFGFWTALFWSHELINWYLGIGL